MGLARAWRDCFMRVVQGRELAGQLQAASRLGKRAWTTAMTAAIIAACGEMGWQASAQGHKGAALPQSRSEYLNIDVMTFVPGAQRWLFPTAVMELENQQDDDYIAYNLWKLLCVRADLRVVYCYRPEAEQGRALMNVLSHEVVGAMTTQQRMTLVGETVLVVGSQAATETFPYGFFKWWRLEKNVGRIRPFM
jgi:hypothetical protein